MRQFNQLAINFPSTGHGGRRPGAGRPKSARPPIAHASRGRITRHNPLHVTLRVREGIPNLRTRRFGSAFRQTLAQCCVRLGFRVIHYSVQTNHAHIIIEANNRKRLANGMKSLAARFARAINRVFGRTGQVLRERYHLHELTSPREVRNALAYVLLNARKHLMQRTGKVPKPGMDAFSSAVWFDGWRGNPIEKPRRYREVTSARCWLLTKGWRKHRLVKLEEVPGQH